MLFRKKVICPSCQSPRCRESRWLSVEEKRSSPNMFPFRCLDCSYRFLSKDGSEFSGKPFVSIPAVIIAVGLAITLTYWLTKPDSAGSSVPTSQFILDAEVLKAAEAGDASAQFRLGESLLMDPARTVASSAKAVNWLRAAAENGNTEAMLVLGRLSRSGVGILQDFSQSAKWTQTAAARGSPEGMLELGRLYRDGIGVDKDLVRAYVWFNRASAARNLDAVRERELISRLLTPEELKQAQSRSSSPDPDPGKSPEKAARKE
jgi:hypothetical protein